MRNDKNRIVLCQKYNPAVHGENHNLIGQILCEYIYKCPFKYTMNINKNVYCKISKNNSPEIATVHYLITGECVCILKTFWLKIFQRTWRSYMNTKQNLKNIHYLLKREIKH